MNSPVLIRDTAGLLPVALSGQRLADLQASILRNRFLPVPPSEDNFVGDGDYLAIGTEFLGHFIELGGLRTHDKVLDVGCGIGRMAVPLTQFLDQAKARYVGFDPAAAGIKWCTQNISTVYPNFRFAHLDVANSLYNPEGYIRGSEVSLPFAGGVFDFAIMTSVVTHLPAEEIEPYFKEISRLLGKGGRLFLSAFIKLPNEHPDAKPRIDFQRAGDGPAWFADEKEPMMAVAFDDGFIERALQAAGFELAVKRLGHWRGGTQALHYQDFFVAVKTRGEAV